MPGTINPIGVGTAPVYPKQATAGAPLDPLVLPGDTNPPILFEPPPGLTAGDLEVWIIATGGIEWGGCQVWISLDNATTPMPGRSIAAAARACSPRPCRAMPTRTRSTQCRSICRKAAASC